MKWSRIGGSVALTLATVAALGARRDAPRDDVSLMVNSATRLLASLSDEQRARTAQPFDSEERTRFHFIPTEMFPREGVTIKEMNETQRAAARSLLQSGLSQRGYMTVSEIMESQEILRLLEGEGARFARDAEEYHIWIFGTPRTDGTWGWRWEGHHLSLHYTIVNGNVTVSAPTFLGTNPAEVPEGPRRGMRPLDRQEDAGRALLGSLSPEQRRIAIFAEDAPTNIVSAMTPQVDPLSPAGIMGSDLAPVQRDLLMDIIESYADLMAPDIAELRMAKVAQDGIENVGFAWAGGTLRGEVSYFRVQGPSFLIEFDHTARDPNHVHSAWRDFDGDFGRDLIREHLQAQAH